MKHYLTGRANEELKKVFRRQEPLRQDPNVPLVRYPLPVLGKATTNINTFELGSFILQQNVPESIVNGSVQRDAYAICPIQSGDICTLMYYGGENSFGYWGAWKCGETPPPTGGTPTDCPLMDDSTLAETFNMIISGVTHNAAPQYPAGWISQSESHINGTFPMTLSATVGRELQPGGLIAPTTLDAATGCQRVFYDYFDLPLYSGGPFGPNVTQVNAMRVQIDLDIRTSIVGFGNAEIYVVIEIEWGFKDGDPYGAGQFNYASGFGTNWSQVVAFRYVHDSPLLTSGSSYTSYPLVGADSDDPDHYEFTLGQGLIGPL